MRTDLISRSAVLEMAFCAIKPTHDCQSVVSVVNVEDIENIPAIDAVPVVRCRECKHLEKEKRQNGETDLFCGLTDLYANPDGYCECGARMDAKSEEDTDETD